MLLSPSPGYQKSRWARHQHENAFNLNLHLSRSGRARMLRRNSRVILAFSRRSRAYFFKSEGLLLTKKATAKSGAANIND
jgi:hypothetical protein